MSSSCPLLMSMSGDTMWRCSRCSSPSAAPRTPSPPSTPAASAQTPAQERRRPLEHGLGASLTKADFAEGVVVAGVQGPQRAPGATSVVVRDRRPSKPLALNSSESLSALCADGVRAVSGGASADFVDLSRSFALGPDGTWPDSGGTPTYRMGFGRSQHRERFDHPNGLRRLCEPLTAYRTDHSWTRPERSRSRKPMPLLITTRLAPVSHGRLAWIGRHM